MSAYIGDFRTGKVIRKMFNTNAVAGESVTMATNGTISVYKDGDTTQSTTGVTFTEDFDGLTGVHLVAVDTSADGTFYSAGSDFEVVVSGATVDGKSINATLFSFSLENRSALIPTVDGRKFDVSAGGEGGVDWANVGSPTATNVLSGTTIKTATDVETDTTEIAAIKAKTDNLPASPAATGDIPTAAQNADAFLDRAGAIETDLTPRQALRLISSTTGGKNSGVGTGTETFRNAVADSKDRVVATVDGSGNRTAITTDLT